MRILTWNINGIRAGIKKGLWDKISDLDVDIVCFQETKADQSIMEDEGLIGHFEYDMSFNSCSIKKGYSGVANFVKINTLQNQESITELGVEEFDDEGRFCATKFEYNNQKIVVINCYYPQGGRDYRIPFKINFYKEVLKISLKYKAQGYKCILCGDFNTTFADIDLARPNENRKTTGCLPIERDVLNEFVDEGFVDLFRVQNPDTPDRYTYWDQITRARERNVGWRIDFFLVDKDLIDMCGIVEIADDVLGSDHCPVILNLK
jgi:exodeoxyribonuclease III